VEVNKNMNKKNGIRCGLGLSVLAVVILMISSSALAAGPTSNPTHTRYWEEITEYSWDVEMLVDKEIVKLDRDESVDIEYTINVVRDVNVTQVIGLRGETGWAHKVQILRNTTVLATLDVDRYSTYDIEFEPLPGVSHYSVKFSYNAPGVSKSTSVSFTLPTSSTSIVVGEAAATLVDEQTFPTDSGLIFTLDRPGIWLIDDCNADDFSVNYALTILNESAAYESEFDVENTAFLYSGGTRLTEAAIPVNQVLDSDSVLTTITTANKPIPVIPILPVTGANFALMTSVGSLMTGMGVVLLSRRKK